MCSPSTLVRLLAPLACALLVWAPTARSDEPVLHEYIPDVDPNEAVLALAQRRGEPPAIVYDGEVLTAPGVEDAAGSGPPMIAAPGDGAMREGPGQRSPTFRPDRLTELEGRLSYYAAFNPAIAPFKRVTSLDAVALADDGRTPVLVVAPESRARSRVQVEAPEAEPPDDRPRDRFWGEARLDFAGGRTVPLPSVSPESRLLSVRTTPSVEVTVERDGAGNFFATARGRVPTAPVHMAFLTDAPQSFFGTEIPLDRADALADHVPPVPASVRARGLSFARELGITRESDLRAALSALTAHFRAFVESRQPPADTGDVYLDLARGKKGVCRHRAYGFVVTAQALGIPARFVQNEAHSWVEVELPRRGFMRIDLGGAADGLSAHGASRRPLYRPVEPDPLPRPDVYEESYSQLGGGNVQGLRSATARQAAGHWVSPDAQGAISGSRATFLGDPDTSLPVDPDAGEVLFVSIDQQRFDVMRGRKLSVSGRIRSAAGPGVPGLRVEVSLAAPRRDERMLLGVTVTREDGRYRGVFGVPPDIDVGDYRLVVITPGDDAHLPAMAP